MQWKVRKKESSLVQGTCVICNDRKQRSKKRNGRVIYLAYCGPCGKKRWKQSKTKRTNKKQSYFGKSRPYNKKYTKKKTCEACGFTGLHLCQLDIDHLDGDHSNNNLENLQTLCANCHRLKTFVQIHDREASFLN